MRKRHQDRSPPDDRKLRDGRSAGAADDEMGGGDPGRQIGEEFRDLDRKAHARASRRHARTVLAARLLGEADPLPLVRVQKRERRGHDIGHDARALRAAGHQKVQAPPDMFGIGDRGGGDDRRPHRVAGHAGPGRIDALEVRKAAGDETDARAQETIGPAHHRILLMQDGRNPDEPRGEQRRHGRIAAEADHGARPDASQLERGGGDAGAQSESSARLGERAGRRGGGGGKGVNSAGGKIAAEFERPAVGRQFDLRAAFGERRRQRRRGEEMSARAAGRKQDRTRRAHPSIAAGCSRSAAGRVRVSAMRKPMPSPSASSEEPP